MPYLSKKTYILVCDQEIYTINTISTCMIKNGNFNDITQYCKSCPNNIPPNNQYLTVPQQIGCHNVCCLHVPQPSPVTVRPPPPLHPLGYFVAGVGVVFIAPLGNLGDKRPDP